MALPPVKAATGPTLAATVLQLSVAKVCEVGAVATHTSDSQTNTAPPAMNLILEATGCCSLAVTASPAKAGAAERVTTAAQAAARVRSFIRALQRFGEWRRPCSRRRPGPPRGI